MRTKQKTAIAIGTAVVAAVGACAAATEYIVRLAMDRNAPKSMSRLEWIMEGQKNGDDPYAFLGPAREKLKKATHETVEIRAHDGLILTGHWFGQENAQRVILAVHGWRSLWYRDFGAIADFWRENACSVLYIEQRGQGNSEGDYIGFGLLERDDLLDWVQWINARRGETLPVYLAGISMGATTVLMAADLDFPANVRGIIADCGFTSPNDIWRHVARKNLHLPYVLMPRIADILCRKRIGMSPCALSTTDSLAQSKLPVLFFHGEDDAFVPVEMSYQNFSVCSSPKRLITVPDAGHGLSYLVDQEGYEDAEKQFWAVFDKKRNESLKEKTL